jgi:hypothetical protein
MPRNDERQRSALTAMQAAESALRQIAALTGHDTQGIVSLEPAEDGWIVGVETVEDRRIPSTADVLAIYEAELDPDGELVAYQRKRQYIRGKGDTGEGQ